MSKKWLQVLLVCLLILAAAVVALAPWNWGAAGVRRDLAATLASDGDLASVVCARKVKGLANAEIDITAITYGGEPMSTATAKVRGTPSDGSAACSGTVTLNWDMASRTSGKNKDSVAIFRNAKRIGD